MASIINADTSGGLKLTSDTSGTIQLQSGGSTKFEVTSTTIVLTGLPTSDPANAGQLWNSSGTLKISAG
tara:strand:+ start:3792 stop:3998 length:207 start_codon:yes stop_codon:yes gene_type:complete